MGGKTDNKGFLFEDILAFMNQQQENAQSLNTEQVPKEYHAICLWKTNELSPVWSEEITQ